MNLERLELKLTERLEYPYVWGSRQTNEKDKKTNFIYKTYSPKAVIKRCAQDNIKDLENYALVRWYNYWSAMGAEQLFAEHERVTPNINVYDRLEDFKIDDISFDHKTSVFPKGFNQDIDYAKDNEAELINWFYKEQSKTKRNLNQNRLFIIVYDKNGSNWKMKANLSLFKEKIDEYMIDFNKNDLHTISFDDGKTALSSIIWIEQ